MVRLLISDGKDELHRVIDAAIADGLFAYAIRLLCFWHAVHKRKTKCVAGASQKVKDVAQNLCRLFEEARRKATTPAEVKEWMQCSLEYLDSKKADNTLNGRWYNAIYEDVYAKVDTDKFYLFPGMRRT